MRFLGEWFRMLLWADSWLGRGLRWAGAVASFGLPFILPDTMNVYIEWPWGAITSSTWSIGWALTAVLAAAYALITVGEARILSKGPKLSVGELPEGDSQYNMFRLRVENVGSGEAVPQVRIREAYFADGSPVAPSAAFPFEIRWSHLGVNERPQIAKDTGGATADLLFIQRPDDDTPVTGFRFGGMVFGPSGAIDQALYVHLVVTMVGHRPIHRWLVFEPDPAAPVGCRVAARKSFDRVRASRAAPLTPPASSCDSESCQTAQASDDPQT